MTEPKKVLLVEDDPHGASLLEAHLRRDGFLVAVAHDGEHGLQLHRHWQPDLLLVEALLPRRSGMEVLAAVRQGGDTPLIMVSAMADEAHKIGALRGGADDYVAKPYSPGEVVARVHALLRRALPRRVALEVLSHGRLRVDLTANEARVVQDGGGSVGLALTRTEFSLLAALLRAPLRVFTRAELVQACLANAGAAERVVDMHIHNLRRKLSPHDMGRVLVAVRAVGYRFR